MLDKNQLPLYQPSQTDNPDLEPHIPISCHFDKDTLLTKDGDLIQIIEITGYGDVDEHANLSEAIRASFKEFIPNFNYSASIHTVRNRKNIMPKGSMPKGFPEELNSEWCKINNWNKQLVNTVYISIIRQGPKHHALDLKALISSLKVGSFKKHNNQILKTLAIELSTVVDNFIKNLKIFAARKLTMLKNKDGEYISEQLMFYYELITFDRAKISPPTVDFSKFLGGFETFFDFNSLEVSTSYNAKNYAALFTIKDAVDLPVEIINLFNQQGLNFIVAQSFYFISQYQIDQEYKELKKMRTLARDQMIDEISGFNKLFNPANTSPGSNCKQQTTIIVYSDDYNFFLSKLNLAINSLNKIGVTFIREDLLMATQYYAQLPGNLKYLISKRLSITSMDRIGGFATLHHHLSGAFNGSSWGDPISIIRSVDGAPFFFNWHNAKNEGHTVLIGPEHAGKTTLIRFLLAQSCKLNPKIIYFDERGDNKKFIESIGGKYFELDELNTSGIDIKLNPFDPANFNNKPEIFKEWLQDIIYPTSRGMEKYDEFFLNLATKLYAPDLTKNKIEFIKEIILATTEETLINGFNSFFEGEFFKKLFHLEKSEIPIIANTQIISINVSSIKHDIQKYAALMPILMQNLKRITANNKSMIVIPNVYLLQNIKSCALIIHDWLVNIAANKAIAIFSLVPNEDTNEDNALLKYINKFSTKIFMCNKHADRYFMRAFKITDAELLNLKSFSIGRRVFLYKQFDVSIMLGLNLNKLLSTLSTLESKNG